MSEKKPIYKEAQNRTLEQRTRRWRDVGGLVGEMFGEKGHRQELSRLRQFDRKIRQAARKMRPLLAQMNRAMLLRKDRDAIRLSQQIMRLVHDIGLAPQFIQKSFDEIPQTDQSPADDSNEILGGVKDWFAEQIGRTYEGKESKDHKAAQTHKIIRELYERMRRFHDNLISELEDLAEHRADRDTKSYVNTLRKIITDQKGMADEYELAMKGLGVDQQLVGEEKGKTEGPKVPPSAEQFGEGLEEEKPEEGLEESEEPEGPEESEQQSGEGWNPEQFGYSFEGVPQWDDEQWERILNAEIQQVGRIQPNTLNALTRAILGGSVKSPKVLALYESYKQETPEVPPMGEFQSYQPYNPNDPQAVFDQGQQMYSENKSNIAAALFLKASQMFEDDGRMEESLKALALAERVLGIRRSGG